MGKVCVAVPSLEVFSAMSDGVGAICSSGSCFHLHVDALDSVL